MAQTPLKKCPQCGALAYMNAAACQNCGRPFQTTNPNVNPNQTQVFIPPPQVPLQGVQGQPFTNKLGWWWYYNKRRVAAVLTIAGVLFLGWKVATFAWFAGTYYRDEARGLYITIEHDGGIVALDRQDPADEQTYRGRWHREGDQLVMEFPRGVSGGFDVMRFYPKGSELVGVSDPNVVFHRGKIGENDAIPKRNLEWRNFGQN